MFATHTTRRSKRIFAILSIIVVVSVGYAGWTFIQESMVIKNIHSPVKLASTSPTVVFARIGTNGRMTITEIWKQSACTYPPLKTGMLLQWVPIPNAPAPDGAVVFYKRRFHITKPFFTEPWAYYLTMDGLVEGTTVKAFKAFCGL
jgi:hypothetical protein